MKYAMTIVVMFVSMMNAAVACAEEAVVGRTLKQSSFVPTIETPAVFERDFVAYLKGLREHPGVVETSFTTKPRYDMCRKPRVISYPERDLMGGVIEGHDCFIFFDGDVQRLKTTRNDMEHLEYQGMEFFVPRDSAIVILGGRFLDNMSRSQATSPSVCNRCSTDARSSLTTCELRDVVPAPTCHVVRYDDINAVALWGLTYGRSLAQCEHYVEGMDVSVSGEVCTVKSLGQGKINADCNARFAIEAREGVNTIFISGYGDGFVKMTNEDTVYAGEGVNLIVVDNSAAPAQRGKVVTSKDEMPCMRIITAEEGF